MSFSLYFQPDDELTEGCQHVSIFFTVFFYSVSDIRKKRKVSVSYNAHPQQPRYCRELIPKAWYIGTEFPGQNLFKLVCSKPLALLNPAV